jgi:hypothetical protein
MSEHLNRVIARLHRADEHLQLFDSKSGDDPTGVCAYGVRRETNADGSIHTYYCIMEPNIDDTLSLLASDCLHNLRSALDNLVFRLAQLNMQSLGKGIPEATQRSIAFPICDSRLSFRGSRKAVACTSMEAKALVRRFQPYNRRESPFGKTLLSLRDLQDIDKHRTLVHISVDREVTHANPIGHRIEGFALEGWFDPVLKDGAPLAYFTVDPPDKRVDVEFNLNPFVLFNEGPPAFGVPASGLLHLIRTEIGEIVGEASQLPECNP